MKSTIFLKGTKDMVRAPKGRTFTLTSTDPALPPVILVKFPKVKGFTWRMVLRAVKSLTGALAGRSVPWNRIHLVESPWAPQAEDEGWKQALKVGQITLYEIHPDGTATRVTRP